MVIRTDNQAPTTPGVPPLIPPNDPARRRAHIALILAAVVLVAVVVGGVVLRKHNQKAGTTTTTNTTASQAGSGTTPTTSLSAVVLAGYVSDQAAWLDVLATFPVDPTDPRLEASLTGAELSAVRQSLTGARLRGNVAVGVDRITRKPRVTELTSTMATVMDCVVDSSSVIHKATGTVVSSGTGKVEPSTATMALTGGAWKIATYVQGGPAC